MYALCVDFRARCVQMGFPSQSALMEDVLALAIGNVTLDEGLFVELVTGTLSASSNSIINVR